MLLEDLQFPKRAGCVSELHAELAVAVTRGDEMSIRHYSSVVILNTVSFGSKVMGADTWLVSVWERHAPLAAASGFPSWLLLA